MQTRLHLLADEPGTYAGQNQQYSGYGYSEMKFNAIATTREGFDAWVEKVRQSQQTLDPTRYKTLEQPSESTPVILFSSVKSGLFDTILHQFNPTMEMHSGAMKKAPGTLPMQPDDSKGS